MQKRVAVLSILLVVPMPAQMQDTISRYGKDAMGAVAPNAAVRLTNEGTGAVRTVLANAAGFYQFPGLVSGTYSIEAEVSGFKKYRKCRRHIAPR
jgi:hypothetical protein